MHVTVVGLRWNVGDALVYTLTVANDHTFYVGSARVLVHNSGIPCKVTYNEEQFLKHMQSGHIQDIRIENRGITIGKLNNPETIATLKRIIEDIVANPDEAYIGRYHGMPDYIFSKRGNSIVVLKPSGEFVTFLRYSAGGDAQAFDNAKRYSQKS